MHRENLATYRIEGSEKHLVLIHVCSHEPREEEDVISLHQVRVGQRVPLRGRERVDVSTVQGLIRQKVAYQQEVRS